MPTHSKAGTWGVGFAVKAASTVALFAAITLFIVPSASAAGGGVVVHKLSDSAKLSRNLDRQKMRSAEPMETLSAELPAGAARSSSAANKRAGGGKSAGKPRFIKGYKPPQLAVAEATAVAGRRAGGFGKFRSGIVKKPFKYRNSTNGKLFGVIPGVGFYTCSASVVHSKHRNVLFTAGHCVKQPGGKFASALIFIPSYTNGKAPYGSWNARSVALQKAWARNGNINYDYAAVKMARDNKGRRVEKVVGSNGFAYNVRKPRKKRYRAVGYPVNKNNSQFMWQCRDKFAGRDPGYRRPGPRAIGIGCDMKNGASGGGWVIRKDRYLNSVTSFGYPSLPNHLYGPRFNRATNKVRKLASR